MKNILLIDPLTNDYKHGMKKMYPSGALILIGTMCQDNGYNVQIIDMVANDVSLNQIKDLIQSFNPDIVGITVNTFQTKSTKEITRIIRQISKDILIVIGGVHSSALGLKIFDDFSDIDISVIGEGEFTFLDIAKGKALSEIKGICYSNKMNELRPMAENLDYMPLPNLYLVDLNKYIGANYETNNSMFLMASRGCPFHCVFCNKSVFGNKVSFRSPSKVIEEIKWLHEEYGISEIFFQDDTFNLNRKWINEILSLIIDSGLNKGIKYIAPFRANKELVDSELLSLMKRANFKWLFYGVESGNQDMLNRMGKDLTLDEIERAVKLTHDMEIKTRCSFILGLPGETKLTVNDTISFLKKLNPTDADIGLATPFPSTLYEKYLKEQNYLINENYDEYRYGGNYIRTDELSNRDLEFLSFVLSYGFHHRWVLNLPLCKIVRFREIQRLLEIYRKYNIGKK